MNKLVSYTSSSSSEDEFMPPAKKKTKLPVPFEPLKRNDRTDDLLKHQGRKRQISHVAGNWSSHLFIDCEHLKTTLCEYLRKVKEFYNDIEIVGSPHVSVSKNFIIKYHWIDNLSKVLSRNIKFNQFPVSFSISNIEFLSNEDKSRHFACILVNESCTGVLEKLVESIDQSLKEFDLPKYYENRVYHASIFWKLTEFSNDEKSIIREEICNFVQNEKALDSIVEKITFKMGNKIKFFNCN